MRSGITEHAEATKASGKPDDAKTIVVLDGNQDIAEFLSLTEQASFTSATGLGPQATATIGLKGYLLLALSPLRRPQPHLHQVNKAAIRHQAIQVSFSARRAASH